MSDISKFLRTRLVKIPFSSETCPHMDEVTEEYYKYHTAFALLPNGYGVMLTTVEGNIFSLADRDIKNCMDKYDFNSSLFDVQLIVKSEHGGFSVGDDIGVHEQIAQRLHPERREFAGWREDALTAKQVDIILIALASLPTHKNATVPVSPDAPPCTMWKNTPGPIAALLAQVNCV